MPPIVRYVRTTNKIDLSQFAEVMTVNEAALGAGVSSDAIRKAIREGKLAAFTPGAEGQPPSRKGGRGQGYRIRKSELERWFFGQPKEQLKLDGTNG